MTILIGNDIVDLSDPQGLGKSRDTRFINRVFSADEKQQILNCSEPDLLLWSLWAGKETAYKAVRKSHFEAISVPRRYGVKLNNTYGIIRKAPFISGAVETPYDPVSIRIFINENYVHCIGITGKSEAFNSVIRGVLQISRGNDFHFSTDSPSSKVRQLAKKAISSYLDQDIEDIDIRRFKGYRGLEPPTVSIKGEARMIDISLSHDGNFVAYAFTDH
jgi:hypothetical protein